METVIIISACSLRSGWQVNYEYSGGTGTMLFDKIPWVSANKPAEIVAPNGQTVLIPCPDAIKESAFGITKKIRGRGMTPWGGLV